MYFQSYLSVLKSNYMLLVIASLLSFLTFFIWAGLPVFIIGTAVAELTTNLGVIHFFICVSGGFLYSVMFIPINLQVAKKIAELKNRSVVSSFLRIETIWILIVSVIFETIFVILIVLQL
ncbi:hypothetical protein JOC75_000644 [Metabacillus crassostreae]|uniref:hypothetical protein n=1 Tax=Metabacillus crassostreae TaxID=929098 RepID=UPI001959B7DC|nr:hypothetical protein [Metabacillus crassostreae]MBM7602674.1 hypothetical protein [Metabacillus crassostreae]